MICNNLHTLVIFLGFLGSLRRDVGEDGLNFAPISPRGILLSEITGKFERGGGYHIDSPTPASTILTG